MKNKNLLIVLIFYIGSLNSSIEEKLRKAIEDNDPVKVEKYLKEGANVNFCYSDNSTPFLLAIKNINNKANKSLTRRILFSITNIIASVWLTHDFGLSIKTNWEKYKSASLETPQSFIDRLNEELKIHKNRIEELKNIIKNDNWNKDILEKERKEKEKNIEWGQSYLNYGKDAKSKYLQQKGILMFRDFLIIIGAITGALGFISHTKKTHDNLVKAQKIALIIKNYPNFRIDRVSLEFINQKIPKYINILKSK